jgi:hypothetical protein
MSAILVTRQVAVSIRRELTLTESRSLTVMLREELGLLAIAHKRFASSATSAQNLESNSPTSLFLGVLAQATILVERNFLRLLGQWTQTAVLS